MGLHPGATMRSPYRSPMDTANLGNALTLRDVHVAARPAPSDKSWGRAMLARVQRLGEAVIGATALVVTSPIMLLIAIIIRLDSPGPALFRQRRVGKNGRLFWFYKFRTLYADARERFPELYAYDYTPEEVQTLKFKREEDPRITRVGRWLRKSTLDELPNFWNLMTGDIALVGPRPEIPEMIRHYQPSQLAKFSVRPGITGLAQTHGRGNLAFQQTIAYDLEYVRSKSLWLDIKIIGRTIWMLVRREGAY
jgi:lipopolysaccharide/colanic/teichoic acid biosynthesis glycosyltransferase